MVEVRREGGGTVELLLCCSGRPPQLPHARASATQCCLLACAARSSLLAVHTPPHTPSFCQITQAWSIVTQAYVDDSFNGTQWDEELVAALGAAADARSPAEARAALPALLDKLGDPFTRWMPAKCATRGRRLLWGGWGQGGPRRRPGCRKAWAGRLCRSRVASSHTLPRPHLCRHTTPSRTAVPPAGSTRSSASAPTAG